MCYRNSLLGPNVVCCLKRPDLLMTIVLLDVCGSIVYEANINNKRCYNFSFYELVHLPDGGCIGEPNHVVGGIMNV
jgi:hypothetical protein